MNIKQWRSGQALAGDERALPGIGHRQTLRISTWRTASHRMKHIGTLTLLVLKVR